jgi:hypothetical protein
LNVHTSIVDHALIYLVANKVYGFDKLISILIFTRLRI